MKNRTPCDLKKAELIDEARIAETEADHDAAIKASREAARKAESIENAVYDLKAVNPHRKGSLIDGHRPSCSI